MTQLDCHESEHTEVTLKGESDSNGRQRRECNSWQLNLIVQAQMFQCSILLKIKLPKQCQGRLNNSMLLNRL